MPKAKYTLKEICIKDSTYTNTTSLKRRLIREGWLDYKCSICGNKGMWEGKELTLQIDHINGDNSDHRIENLRILCPNCHSQTETYSGRNVSKSSTEKRPSKDELLKNDLRNLPKIAKKYNVSLRTVYNWFDKYDIEHKSSKYDSTVLTDKEYELIHELYATNEWTHRSLMKKFNVSKGTIQRVLEGSIK